MDFGLLHIMQMLGALGLFIYGMKVMSEGIQKATGAQLRKILSAMTANRFLGLISGMLITALLQSSSATTVTVVGFVNAGLLTLTESIGVILGANIGTTITAWLVTLESNFSLASFALPIVALAVPLLFFNRSRFRALAESLIGFALLLLALFLLKTTIPDLRTNPDFLEFIQRFSGSGFFSVAVGLVTGAIFTGIVQSSSAAMALTFILASKGYIPYEMAAGMVLGENIGTTVTANIAALVANVNGKRAALAHLLVNLLGLLWMIPLFVPFMVAIDWTMTKLGMASPAADPTAIPLAMAFFHTAFNVTNSIILLGFVPSIAGLVKRLIKARDKEDERHTLEFIGLGTMVTAELALVEAKRELARQAAVAKKMLALVRRQLVTPERKAAKELYETIRKYEKVTDRIEVEVGDYLLKIAEQDLSETASLRVRSMLSISDELERIADRILQMARNLDRKMRDKTWFTPQQRNAILEMYDLLGEALEIMIDNLEKEYEQIDIAEASRKEEEINNLRDKLRTKHLKSTEKSDYNIKSGLIYTELFTASERIGDHIINVSRAAMGEV